MAKDGTRRGRPKGSKSKKTLDKELAREMLRQQVMASMGPLVEAQIANARGIKYLVVRERKGGKFVRVTEAMARLKQGSDEEIIEVWEKDPSTPAFTDLMNRTIDKPAETVAAAVEHSGALVIEWQK